MLRTIKVVNKSGIHVRPAAQIAELANKFQSKIIFIKDGIEVNSKSIMELLTLAAGGGTLITIKTEGPDELAAMDAIEALVSSKFSET